MPETRLINVELLKDTIDKRICKVCNRQYCETCKVREVISIAHHSPIVDAVPVKLYHVTTPKKAKRYRETGAILKPVRGFTTLDGAMAWAIKTGRTVIYEVEGAPAYKLPDHHNKFGDAWWIDSDVPVSAIKCVRFE